MQSGSQPILQTPMFGGGLMQETAPAPMVMTSSRIVSTSKYFGNAVTPNGVCTSANLNLVKAVNKVDRELFVGNIPSDTSEAMLGEFLNGTMQRSLLCQVDRMPVIGCRVGTKYAFIECETVEDANMALNLDGVWFRGARLRVSRPAKYTGPFTPCQTWQDPSGHHLERPYFPENITSNDEKEACILVVGNTNSQMTEYSLSNFLGEAMGHVELTEQPGNPIVSCQINDKLAYVEFRSAVEASAALNLNNIPFMGSHLRIERSSKYAEPTVASKTWEEVLSIYMARKLKAEEVISKYMVRKLKTVSKKEVCKPKQTRIVQLKNMLTMDDLESDEDYNEVKEETREECAEFGYLKKIVIPRRGVGSTKIFLEYNTIEDAAKAIMAMAGRTFDGRTIDATYMDEVKYFNHDYSD